MYGLVFQIHWTKPELPVLVMSALSGSPCETGEFAFLWPPSDLLSIVPKAGTLIARDGDREIDHVPAQDELLEPGDHGVPFVAVRLDERGDSGSFHQHRPDVLPGDE